MRKSILFLITAASLALAATQSNATVVLRPLPVPLPAPFPLYGLGYYTPTYPYYLAPDGRMYYRHPYWPHHYYWKGNRWHRP
jgi:hypothetical protein